MVEENKNEKKISVKKRRYLSVLLFLAFAVGILNSSSFRVSAQTPSQAPAQTSTNGDTGDGVWMWLGKKAAWLASYTTPTGAAMRQGISMMDQTVEQKTGQKNAVSKQIFGAPVSEVAGSALVAAFNYLLYGVLWVIAKLLLAAGYLLDVAADPIFFRKILNSNAVSEGWKMIRDFCNLAFIMVLLFSAFCTIFQVQKFHLKKILLTLVIIALLVNFSFPISRFIIDFANVTMYYILNHTFPVNSQGVSLSAKFAGVTQIGDMLLPKEINGSWNLTAQLLMSIIFVFVLMATMMVTAVTLLVRVVVLAILVIFSAGGFAATILPSTENLSKSWWDNLFKYALIGPILIFFLYFALRLMQFATVDKVSLSINMQTGKPDDNFLPTFVLFALPVTVLWIGLSMSQKMGAVGAKFATDKLTKLGKGAMKKFSGYNYAKKQIGDYKKSREARKEEARWKPGKRIADKFNDVQDSTLAKLGSKDAQRRMDRRKRGAKAKMVRDEAEDLKGARIEDLNIEINNSFDATTGNVDPSKVNRTSAGNAQAYMNKQGDDRKTFVEDEIRNRGGANIANMMFGAPANILAAQASVLAGPGPTNPGYQDALRQMTSYINKKAEELVTAFTG